MSAVSLDTIVEQLAGLVAAKVLAAIAEPRSVPPAPPADFLSERQLAERLNLSPRTLQGWRAAGKGPPFVRAGSRVLYPVADLKTWLTNSGKDSR